MRVRFAFRVDRSELLGGAARPMAEVLLRGEDGFWIRALMYVDSAADLTLIPLKLGEALGLKYRPAEVREVRGLGRKPLPVVLRKLQIKLAGKSIYAHIAWSLVDEVPLVLGRRDVFDLFKVSIDQAKQVVIFE